MRGNPERILWFVVGVGFGTGVALLFGTRTGRRYRRQMARIVEDGCDQVDEVRQDVLERGKEVYERGREFVEEAGSKVARSLHLAHK